MDGFALAYGLALWLLGLGIILYCLYLAFAVSIPAFILTLLFPVLAQIYWSWRVGTTTGIFFNGLTIACLAWVSLLAAGFLLAGVVD